MQAIRRPKMRDQVSEQIKQYIIEGKTGVLPHVARPIANDSAIETHLRNLTAPIAIDIQFHHSLIDASGLKPL